MVRVRFAPSPTGYLHIGGVRTALYNYLFARNQGGRFILRIEDTDRSRFVQDAESYIQKTLRWLDIEPDESPWHGGKFGPYRQSERTEHYQHYIQRLLTAGKAYYAFDTEEELENMRSRMKAAGVTNPQYNASSRMYMRNALTLPQEEVQALLKTKCPSVVRLKVPSGETLRFYDRVRGWIKVQTSTLDDKVLCKSDGLPTYHFASVVDDHLMQISHVIRGEEWIPSTPIHVLLYRYLECPKVPEFVHLPLLLKPEGVGKLSKRDAEHYGFPVFPLSWQDPERKQCVRGFRQEGYLAEALINFLALLGWSPKGERECLSRKELVESFDLQGLGKAGVKFDIRKAGWFNQQHLRAQPVDVLAQYLRLPLKELQINCSDAHLASVTDLVKERAVFPEDFWRYGRCFFVRPSENITLELKPEEGPALLDAVQHLVACWREEVSFTKQYVQDTFGRSAQHAGVKVGRFMQVVRSALTGLTTGAELVPTTVLIGAREGVARLQKALEAYTKTFENLGKRSVQAT